MFRKKDIASSKHDEVSLPKSFLDSLKGYQLIFRIALGAALVFGITFFYPVERMYLPIEIPQVGEISTRDIQAPFEFPVLKSAEELKKERELVLANIKPVLILDTLRTSESRKAIRRFFILADSLSLKNAGPTLLVRRLHQSFPELPESLLVKYGNRKLMSEIRPVCLQMADSLTERGIFADLTTLPFESSGLVNINRRGKIKISIRNEIIDMPALAAHLQEETSRIMADRPELAPEAMAIVKGFLQPNLSFDLDATEINRNRELESIRQEKGWVFKGEKIIRTNERVTEHHREKLISLAKYAKSRPSEFGFWQFLLPPLGRLFFVAFPIIFFGIYLYYFRKTLFASNSALALFATLIGSMIVILYIITQQEYLSPYLVPLTIASMIVTIAYDLETGLFLTFAMSLLAGILAGFKLDLAFVGIASGTVAAFSVRKVRHRHEFYQSILFLAMVYFGAIYLIESLKLTPPAALWRHVGFGIINGFLSPILTIGLLPLFEITFKLTTDITLLELSDLNRPLLKRLALEAPGTYHHSIMIGTLAEEASKSINANSLLARVGSYYHDIGKMQKPEYFVENQMGAKNKHEKLTPSMSALILEAHVKEGIELAKRHGLPESIIEFITGHHGTGVMSYFYEKAKSQEGDGINIDEYRYPGPKPRSREVAIVMLADSVEAASRTLEDPKPARIRGLVKKSISTKFESGELENCDLTLRELHLIEDSFVRVLTGIFHRRIDYPNQNVNGERS